MKNLFFLFAIFFACTVRADADVDESNVNVLTTDNFDSFIGSHEFVLVEFYAPWCGHCKRLVPEYAEAATTLKTAGATAVLAKVDATVEQALGTRFSIQGYPTLKFFRSGQPTDYDGGRTANEIVQWVNKKSGPVSKVLASQADIDSFVSGKGTKVVGFLSAEQESVWNSIALDKGLSAFAFAHVADSALLGSKSVGTVELHKEGEDVQTYTGEFTKEAVVAWLLSEGFPLVDELNQESFTRGLDSGSDILAVFLSSKTDSHFAVATEVAKAFRGKLMTTWSSQIQIASRWGSSGEVVPVAIYVKNSGQRPQFIVWNEATEKSFDVESLSAFAKAAAAGEYKSFRKSEAVPENDGPVTVVVGKTFEEVVFQPKDVLVEFYAPWCGHCKSLAPIYEELGASFKGDDGIVIAKIDATANGYPEDIDVQGFPTIILFTSNNLKIAYDGERDLESFKKWIAQNRTTKKASEEL